MRRVRPLAEKYFIFKIEEEDGKPTVGELVTDGTVIRRQDKLASTTLETYAALAQGAIEILEEVRSTLPRGIDVYNKLTREIEGLERSRDYMKNEAELAQREGRKLPD
jgi:hypothetical protein